MSEQDAGKHDDLPEQAASQVVIAGHRLNVPTTPPLQETGPLSSNTGVVSHWFCTKQARQRPAAGSQRHGDTSVLDFSDDLDAVRSLRTGALTCPMSHNSVQLHDIRSLRLQNAFGASRFQTAIYWSRDSTRALQGNDSQPTAPSHPRVRASKVATPFFLCLPWRAAVSTPA